MYVLFSRVVHVRPDGVPTLRLGTATEERVCSTVSPGHACSRKLDAQPNNIFIRIICGGAQLLWSDTAAVPDTWYISTSPPVICCFSTVSCFTASHLHREYNIPRAPLRHSLRHSLRANGGALTTPEHHVQIVPPNTTSNS